MALYPGFTAAMEPSIVLPMSYDPNDNDDDDIDYGPSKSELKRQSQGLQDLGEQLIGLPQAEFDEIDLPEALRDAVALARRITAHGGLYRQKQYIGKLMRNIDAEPIRKALEARNLRQRSETLRLRKVEAWRAKLIEADGEAFAAALGELLSECPGIDHRTVTRLVSQARHEHDRGQPPRSSRELFAVLRDALGD
ncbi:MAG: ribosome biogenesis factor YjgA [Steroidobacteraceae bacterium]